MNTQAIPSSNHVESMDTTESYVNNINDQTFNTYVKTKKKLAKQRKSVAAKKTPKKVPPINTQKQFSEGSYDYALYSQPTPRTASVRVQQSGISHIMSTRAALMRLT